jgi:ribosome-binding factor A
MKTPHKKAAQELKLLCADPRPEDGISPIALKQQQQRQQRKDHPPSQARARQYCKAVHRALEAGLSHVIGDPRLQDLTIQSVEPLHAGGSNLLVIAAMPLTDPKTMKTLEQTLQKTAGLLRSVIATEIQRKRTPHLTFRVVPET